MAKKDKHDIPVSGFMRATKLFASGARVAAREVAAQISGKATVTTRIKQAQDMVETLGKLKGAAMKAGQLLSIEAAEYLDPEVVAILRKLQDQVSFMQIDQVRFILQRQFGREKFETIEDLSTEPIAAASIGQVHKAKIGSHIVAIKIQYPGVAKSIDSDLASLRTLAMTMLKVSGKKVDLEPVLDEITKSLKQEVNYLIEAKNMDLARQHFTDSSFVIPSVIHQYTTETVLTQSFEHGVRLNDWIKSQPGAADTDAFTALIVHLLVTEIFATGVVQTDPNYANFLYRPEDRKLVLLDFGATWTYESEFRQRIQRLLMKLLTSDSESMVQAIVDHGYFSPKESDETREKLRVIIDILQKILQNTAGLLSLKDGIPHGELRDLAQSLGLSINHTSPPKDLVLIGRKLGGMVRLLQEINAIVHIPNIQQKIATVAII